LPDRVVDLVRAGMRQVFSLQVDLCSTDVFRQVRGQRQWRRATDVRPLQVLEFSLELRVAAHLCVRVDKLVYRGHERLRRVDAAELAEPSVLVRIYGRRVLLNV